MYIKYLKILALLLCNSIAYGFSSSTNGDTLRNLRKLNIKQNVVLHIVVEENGQPAADSVGIISEIKNLIQGFSPIGITFLVCDIRKISKSDEDVPDSVFNNVRHLLNSYSESRAINIFFVPDLNENQSHKCSFILGNIVSDDPLGIFISCLEQGVVLHEFVHFF